MTLISPPTLLDVARRAGVSTATVSRCLNSPDRVVEKTRAKVLKAVEDLRYTPNFGGRALASNRTNTVGAIVPTLTNAIFAVGLDAFESELARANVTLLVASTGFDPDREFDQVRALVGRGADGLLLIGWDRPQEIYDFLDTRRVPHVIAWNARDQGDRPCAGFDNRHAARVMAERVLSLGHRRIAMIAGVTRFNDRAADRLAGVRDAVSAARFPHDAMPVVEAPYTLNDGSRAMADLLSAPVRPTAVICGNDVLAVGALRAARAAGLNVPDDISITGFDDIELASVVSPALTTVHVPHKRMGGAAASLLLGQTHGSGQTSDEATGHTCHFVAEVVERGSLGPPPA